MSNEKRERTARMEKTLRMKEELAIIERIEAESRLSNIAKSQDDLQEGRSSIFTGMAAGLYAEVANFSIVGASERERKAATARQNELKQLRGMRKALQRILGEQLQREERSANEEIMQELSACAAHLGKATGA